MKANLDLVRQNVMDAEFSEAFKLLNAGLANTPYGGEVILLQQRYNRSMKEKGTIDEKDFDVKMNQITLSIIDLVTRLKTDFVNLELLYEPQISFFAAPDSDGFMKNEDRVFVETFKAKKVHRIGWQIMVGCHPMDFPLMLNIKWRLRFPDNSYSAYWQMDAVIQPGDETVLIEGAFDLEVVDIGVFAVEVLLEEVKMVQSKFEITDN